LSLIKGAAKVSTKFRTLVFCSLLIVSGALVLSVTCDQEANHRDFGAVHQALTIECFDEFLTSRTQASLEIQLYKGNWSKLAPTLSTTIVASLLVRRFKHQPLLERLSQQYLFRFKEVYRL
jgi:hypothetical protein